jgi:hypothetical protein
VFALEVNLLLRGVGEGVGVKTGCERGRASMLFHFCFLERGLFLLHFLMASERASELCLAVRHDDVYDYDL